MSDKIQSLIDRLIINAPAAVVAKLRQTDRSKIAAMIERHTDNYKNLTGLTANLPTFMRVTLNHRIAESNAEKMLVELMALATNLPIFAVEAMIRSGLSPEEVVNSGAQAAELVLTIDPNRSVEEQVREAILNSGVTMSTEVTDLAIRELTAKIERDHAAGNHSGGGVLAIGTNDAEDLGLRPAGDVTDEMPEDTKAIANKFDLRVFRVETTEKDAEHTDATRVFEIVNNGGEVIERFYDASDVSAVLRGIELLDGGFQPDGRLNTNPTTDDGFYSVAAEIEAVPAPLADDAPLAEPVAQDQAVS